MGADRALSIMDQMLWTAAIVAGPILGAILIVGILISVIQVATQIQEMTLTYVPKLIVSVLLLIILGSWMIGKLVQFSRGLFLLIPSLAH
ncbi:flagellar biosynthetic protein FliQ [Novosphingobium sp. AAP1]|uniref:flagellar biosynthetic protein FliQ n=1 Tax=Novosphingobium sp. AAP1 TaxID=1523413 RepID=UPI0006B9E929|nr:flagellar biosynthetic protein FliQ [Novosphingobium sp. AAP1]KPF52065.1 flagellar biosynthetic protein FliQ [Novosphingobium sp. AAP1]